MRPRRPTYTGSASSALTMCPRHRSSPKRRRARSRAVSRWTSRSRSSASWPGRPGARRSVSRRSVSSATVCSSVSANVAKCCSSAAMRVGSALGARWSGRSNALVVGGVTASAPAGQPLRDARAGRTHGHHRRVPATAPRGHRRFDVPARPHVDNTTRISRPPFPRVLASVGDSAARPGSCRKPPGGLYVESGRELVLLPFAVRGREVVRPATWVSPVSGQGGGSLTLWPATGV